MARTRQWLAAGRTRCAAWADGRPRLAIMLLIVLGLVVAGTQPVQGQRPPQGGGPAFYPDLQTRPPTDLQFDTEVLGDGQTHHVLRFANTVWNAGQGRLELEGKKRSKIYQNVYNAATGGTLVQRLYVGNDSTFHEGHNHYHLENFASYLLLQQDMNGAYQATTKKGTKTSFCIMDTEQLLGSYSAQYTRCDRVLQGLTVGWADTYGAYLVDQWIDLGTSPLTDGEYAVQSTADPRDQLAESNNANNVAVTYFRVEGGTIMNVR